MFGDFDLIFKLIGALGLIYFLCLCHKMAEGHIEFTCPYVCVFSFVYLCVPESCLTHNFILHYGI